MLKPNGESRPATGELWTFKESGNPWEVVSYSECVGYVTIRVSKTDIPRSVHLNTFLSLFDPPATEHPTSPVATRREASAIEDCPKPNEDEL